MGVLSFHHCPHVLETVQQVFFSEGSLLISVVSHPGDWARWQGPLASSLIHDKNWWHVLG